LEGLHLADRIQIVRHRDLLPFWGVKRATEPGFMRSLITWMGGPEGYINTNIEHAVESQHCAVGVMDMAVGNRQPGVHVHTMNEIYVILDGQVESIDGVGNKHIAGPLDCLFIPTGVPHGVRTVGDQDVKLLWINDDLEKWGAAVYLEGPDPAPAENEISLIEMKDLESRWSNSAVPGEMHWNVNWVAGRETDHNSDVAVPSDRISLELCVVQPANRIREPVRDGNQLFVVAKGQAVAKIDQDTVVLDRQDAIFFPIGTSIDLRCISDEPLALVKIVELSS
jgi:mannose-6-phosphate isomerase-like protein (cupin superfamily)